MLPSEQNSYTDSETGRRVTVWTSQCTGHNYGLYYTQNPFDRQRNQVYFISNRTGAWQLWRADMADGRLQQVTDIPGILTVHHAHVSPLSGRIFLAGSGRIYTVDPDTFAYQVIWDPCIDDCDPARRFHRQNYAFPSCDDRWVYFLTRYASEDELAAAEVFMQATTVADRLAGRRIHGKITGLFMLPGMLESPLEMTFLRVEVATGRVEELWRGHASLQHPLPSPTDSDLAVFASTALTRPIPNKYSLVQAGSPPIPLVADEINAVNFHEFWHPGGEKLYVHRCENLEPIPEIYAPIPGKMRFYVREVDVAGTLATGTVQYRDWFETAGEKHVHLHLNIAPDGAFLVGDGQSDCPYICRLDWQEDNTIPATPLCRIGYASASLAGVEPSPNVHVSPDGAACFFTTHIDGEAQLASVDTYLD
jgi:hypothetical protein